MSRTAVEAGGSAAEQNEERVIVTTIVDVRPEAAFRAFTQDIDLWWKRSPRYRRMPGQTGKLSFEGTPPERLVERSQDIVTEIGRVIVWDAGKRLTLEWHGGEFGPMDRTRVDVLFEAHRGGTRVTLEHTGFSTVPAQHRARHGLSGEALEAMQGYFWADLLTRYRTRCAAE